jgi:SAM-dependent methyltransferase
VSAAEERLQNDPTSELWGEHRSRYRFAAQWAAGKRVLDVASGAGFGLQILREAGACAIGIDLAQPNNGARLVQADALRLPIAEASVDLIASFETIEHVPDARGLVRELRRVLRPQGMLVLSTPHRAFRHSANPFHIQEFTADELHSLLVEAFEDVRIHGQWPDRAYRFVPFLMLERDWTPRAILWKLLNRLPFSVKDGLARATGGHSWYPSEADYRFEEGRWDGAHALLAIAR